MGATDYFLFSLAFLVSALLAGWIRHLSREQDGLSGSPLTRARGGELVRLTASLAAALSRIEALERRHEELVRELGTDAQERSQQGRGSPTPEPASEPEVSPSQWRTAMDRLGPAWQSGSRPTDPGQQASPVEGGDVATRRDLELAPSSLRRDAPLDDLFPPTVPFAEPPSPGGDGTARDVDRDADRRV